MYTIAITGGIGSGKSVISTILRIMGYSVYDSDSEAKRLMNASNDIKHEIASRISPDVITSDGHIDRTLLSSIVFADDARLRTLNAIVHTSVRNDFSRWCSRMNIAFIETAILYQSGLDKMVDEVWEVTASIEVRVNRVMKRNGLTAEQVRARIHAQQFNPANPHPRTHQILNDPTTAILPQLHPLLHHIKQIYYELCK